MAGGIVATTVDCASGRASVQQMRATFESLRANNPNFDSHRFQTSVESIEATLNATYSWWDEWIPFNPNCGALQSIGQQADKLSADMLASVGAAPTGTGTSAPNKGFDVSQLTKLLIVAGVLYLVVVVGVPLWKQQQ